MTENQIYLRLDRYRDAALTTFETAFADLLRRAQDATIDVLLERLDLVKSVIQPTATNRNILRKVDQLLLAQMERRGFSRLVSAFVGQFAGQLPLVTELLDLLRSQVRNPWPELKFTSADTKFMAGVASSMGESIKDAVGAAVETQMRKVAFSFGTLPFKEMTRIIRDSFDLTEQQAQSTAVTAMSGFYRVGLEHQSDKIEKNLGRPLRYRYTGIRDERNRPFCRTMLDRTKAGTSWTKDEANALDNGARQPKPVFEFCGGWGCRGHQFLLDVEASGLLEKAA